MRRGVLITGLLWIVALFGSGCIVPSQEAIRKADGPLQNPNTSQSEMRTESGSLIKPIIPQEARADFTGRKDPGGWFCQTGARRADAGSEH